jgi:hypothetical protein
MRDDLTPQRLRALMDAIAESAPRRAFRVFFIGGTTAVFAGWRAASNDADLFADDDAVFRDIQGIKERLNVSVEFVRPEQFVPELRGRDGRHVFVATVGRVSYYHYDPYSQVFAKVVRGLDRDLEDARAFIRTGMVEPEKLRSLVDAIPDSAYAKYPHLSRAAASMSVETLLSGLDRR